jgi:hypothetical protein
VSAKRVGNWFVVGEGSERWAFPDPSSATAGECATTLHYLLVMCPDTKTATEKLRTMRRLLHATTEGQQSKERTT